MDVDNNDKAETMLGNSFKFYRNQNGVLVPQDAYTENDEQTENEEEQSSAEDYEFQDQQDQLGQESSEDSKYKESIIPQNPNRIPSRYYRYYRL